MNVFWEWIRAHPEAPWWIAAASILMFVTGLLLVPVIIARIPRDYFARKRRRIRSTWAGRHVAVRAMMLVAKNALGLVLLVLGIVLLVLPGQGILTVAAAIMLLDFPGKFRLERWLISQGPVLRTMNWLRRRANREPLIIDD